MYDMCDVFIQHRYNVIYISHLMFSVSWNAVRVCVSDVFIQHRYNVIYISHLMFSVSWNVLHV